MKLEAIKDLMLYGDNKVNIALIKNVESQHQTKYINVQYYYIKKLVNKKELTIKWISKSKMLVDGMMKALLTKTFKKYQALLELTIR